MGFDDLKILTMSPAYDRDRPSDNSSNPLKVDGKEAGYLFAFFICIQPIILPDHPILLQLAAILTCFPTGGYSW